jgi:hypothetical protein
LKSVAGRAFEGRCRRISAQSASAMPCQQCRRSHDCGDLIENPPAKPFGFGGKPPPLAIRKSKAATSELLPENTILLDKILDDLLLPLVHPTGNGNDEKRKWIQKRPHRRSVSRPEPIYAGLSVEPLRT